MTINLVVQQKSIKKCSISQVNGKMTLLLFLAVSFQQQAPDGRQLPVMIQAVCLDGALTRLMN